MKDSGNLIRDISMFLLVSGFVAAFIIMVLHIVGAI